jgi:hypothetical protein
VSVNAKKGDVNDIMCTIPDSDEVRVRCVSVETTVEKRDEDPLSGATGVSSGRRR